MGFKLREALRRLCVEIGWSYAVFWRTVGSPSPKHLVWEDGHWFGKLQLSGSDDVNAHVNSLAEFQSRGEGIIDALVNKTMVPQVHVIGVGIVGQAASTGKHQWILRNGPGDNDSTLKHLPDVNKQFLSGIQTIVIMPVLPHGVVQFGSTNRVMENVLFVNHARTSFMQLALELGSSIYGVTQKAFGQSCLPRPSISPAISDYLFRDDCSNVDRSWSLRCNHQLSISSATRSLSQSSSSLSTEIQESLLEIDAEGLLTKKNVNIASMPLAELDQSIIHQAGNSLFHRNKQLKNELPKAQVIPNDDFMSPCGMPVTSGSLSFMKKNLLLASGGRTQDPAVDTKASVDVMFGNLDTDSSFSKIERLGSAKGLGRLTSASACTSEILHTHSNVSCANPQGMIQNINKLNGNEAISINSHVKNVSKKSRGSILGNLKQENDLSHAFGISSSSCGVPLIGLQECKSGSSSTIRANQGFQDDSYNVEKMEKICAEDDSSFIYMPNEKSSSFSHLATSGDDLFDVLGLYGSLDRDTAREQQLFADVLTCNTQLNLSPIFYPVDDDTSCTEIFTVSNTDQLLDAVVSSIYTGAKKSLDDTLSWKTSVKKSIHCASPSNDGSTSSGQKQGGYISSSITCNAEAAGATSVKTADSIDEIERLGYNKSQISLWVENEKNMKSDNLLTSHGKMVDEVSKVNRKRARPGETPRPRPKDRQLIMDRVKELREIIPNGAKCSIDTLLEKTIKHMLFLQSVTKHADKLKETGEPKIVIKDGGVALKDNFRGGATWAFEVGSQTLTCPIIVEDLNPPREMLVEMLCEERGLFLEIADLIRGLGLTILKGLMEARRDKIWARFAVEANRDVTRMEIFLSLVHLLEPTIGSGTTPHSINNSKMPHKIFSLPCVPATGISDPLQ